MNTLFGNPLFKEKIVRVFLRDDGYTEREIEYAMNVNRKSDSIETASPENLYFLSVGTINDLRAYYEKNGINKTAE